MRWLFLFLLLCILATGSECQRGIVVPAEINLLEREHSVERLVSASDILGERLAVVLGWKCANVTTGSTRHSSVLDSIARLQSRGAKVLGRVLTRQSHSMTNFLESVDGWYSRYSLNGLYLDAGIQESNTRVTSYSELVGELESSLEVRAARPMIFIRDANVREAEVAGLDAVLVRVGHGDDLVGRGQIQTLPYNSTAVIGLGIMQWTLFVEDTIDSGWIYSNPIDDEYVWTMLPYYFEEFVSAVATGAVPSDKPKGGFEVHSIFPSSGSLGGGTMVTLRGLGLSGITEIRMGSGRCALHHEYKTDTLVVCASSGVGPLESRMPTSWNSFRVPLRAFSGVNIAKCFGGGCFFTYCNERSPFLASVSPRLHEVGDSNAIVTVAGRHLSSFRTSNVDLKLGTSGSCKVWFVTPDGALSCNPRVRSGFHELVASNKDGGSALKAFSGLYSPSGSLYDVAVAPVISAISPRAGFGNGWVDITVSGRFDVDATGYTVNVGAAKCSIRHQTNTEIVCGIQPGVFYPVHGLYMGGYGLRDALYDIESPSLVSLSSHNQSAVREEMIRDLDVSFSSNTTGGVAEGYFLPPKSGQYQFYVSLVDGEASLGLSSDDDPENTVTLVTADRISASPEGGHDFFSKPFQHISDPVYLSGGERYYMKVSHATNGFSIAAGLLSTQSLSGFANAVNEVQRYRISSNAQNEVQRISFADGFTDPFTLAYGGEVSALIDPASIDESQLKTAIIDILGHQCYASYDGIYMGFSFEGLDWKNWSSGEDGDDWRFSIEDPYCGRRSSLVLDGAASIFDEKSDGAGGYSLTEYPVMCMAYRVPSTSIVAMKVEVSGLGWVSLRMTGTPECNTTMYSAPEAGSWAKPPRHSTTFSKGFNADNQWHYQCIDLHAQFLESLPKSVVSSDIYISRIELGAPFHESLCEYGGHIWVDEFFILKDERPIERVPHASGTAASVGELEVSHTLTSGTHSYDIFMETCKSGLASLLSVSSGSVVITRHVVPIVGLGGSFELLIGGFSTGTIPVGASPKQLKHALPRGVERVRVIENTCSTYEFEIEFSGHEDHPLSSLLTSGVTSGSAVSASVKTVANGGLFWGPIPAMFLRSAHQNAQVVVTGHDGVLSLVTSASSAGFSEVSIDARILDQVDKAVAKMGESITIGMLNYPYGLAETRVLVGKVACEVTAVTSSSVSCTIGASSCGENLIRVFSLSVGEIALNRTNTPPTVWIELDVNSIDSDSGDMTGGTEGGNALTLSGSGFGILQENLVMIGGSYDLASSSWSNSCECTVTYVNSTRIMCVTTKCSTLPEVNQTVTVQVFNNTGALLDSRLAPLGYKYATSRTPFIMGHFPLEGSAAGGWSLKLNGTKLDNALNVQIGERECHIDFNNATHITCRMPPVPPGNHTVLVTTLKGGVAGSVSPVVVQTVLAIHGVSQSTGSLMGGNLLRIFGSGFVESSQNFDVMIGNTTCSVERSNSSFIECLTSSMRSSHNMSIVAGLEWKEKSIRAEVGDVISFEGDIHSIVRILRPGAIHPKMFTVGHGAIVSMDMEGDWIVVLDSNPSGGGIGTISVHSATGNVKPQRIQVTIEGIEATHDVHGTQEFSGCSDVTDLTPTVLYYHHAICVTPKITEVTPSSGERSSLLTIRGHDFIGFGNINVTLISQVEADDDDIRCTVVSHEGTLIVCIVEDDPRPVSYSVQVLIQELGTALDYSSGSFEGKPHIRTIDSTVHEVSGAPLISIAGSGLSLSKDYFVGDTPCVPFERNDTFVLCSPAKEGGSGYNSFMRASGPAGYWRLSGWNVPIAPFGDAVDSLFGIELCPSSTEVLGSEFFTVQTTLLVDEIPQEPQIVWSWLPPLADSSPGACDEARGIFLKVTPCGRWELWVAIEDNSGLAPCDVAFETDECSTCVGTRSSGGQEGVPCGNWLLLSSDAGAGSSAPVQIAITLKRNSGTDEVRLLVNGVLKAFSTTGTSLYRPCQPWGECRFVVGMTPTRQQAFAGIVHDVAIYDYAMRVDDVSSAYDFFTEENQPVSGVIMHESLQKEYVMARNWTSQRYMLGSSPTLSSLVSSNRIKSDQVVSIHVVGLPVATSSIYAVLFGGYPCTTWSRPGGDATSVLTCTPPHVAVAGKYALSVSTTLGGSSDVYVDVYPSVHSLSPSRASVYGGTIVTIWGDLFSSISIENVVTIDGSDCPVLRSNQTTIVCETSAHISGSCSNCVQVRTYGVEAQGSHSFEYSTANLPAVSSVPSSITPGTRISILGSGFTSEVVTLVVRSTRDFSFPCSVHSISDSMIQCEVPTWVSYRSEAWVHIFAPNNIGLAHGPTFVTLEANIISISPSVATYGSGHELTIEGAGYHVTTPTTPPLPQDYMDWIDASCEDGLFAGAAAGNTSNSVVIVNLDSVSPDEIDTLHVNGNMVVCAFSCGTTMDYAASKNYSKFDSLLAARDNNAQWWLDILNSDLFVEFLTVRVDEASMKSCDAVDFRNIAHHKSERFLKQVVEYTGVNNPYKTSLIPYMVRAIRSLAGYARSLGLRVSVHDSAELVPYLLECIDMATDYSCRRNGLCHLYDPLYKLGKPVLQLSPQSFGAANCSSLGCRKDISHRLCRWAPHPFDQPDYACATSNIPCVEPIPVKLGSSSDSKSPEKWMPIVTVCSSSATCTVTKVNATHIDCNLSCFRVDGECTKPSSDLACDVSVGLPFGKQVAVSGGLILEGANSPVVTKLVPTLGPVHGNTEITIDGSDFPLSAGIRMSEEGNCPISSISASRIICNTPSVESSAQLNLVLTDSVTGSVIPWVGEPTFSYVFQWGDPDAWPEGRVPVDEEDVVIPEGKTYLLEYESSLIGKLCIHGTLLMATTGWPVLHASSIHIRSGGSLIAGTLASPYIGPWSVIYLGEGRPREGSGQLLVEGSLEVHSDPIVPWTTVSSDHTWGVTSLTLADSVNWKPGIGAVMAPTGYNLEFDFIDIASVNGNSIGLASATSFLHDGTTHQYSGGAHSLPQVSEVATMGRGLNIIGMENSGGHLMVQGDDASVNLSYVKFYQMGSDLRAALSISGTGRNRFSNIQGCVFEYPRGTAVKVTRSKNVVLERNVFFGAKGHSVDIQGGPIGRVHLENNLVMYGLLSTSTMNAQEAVGIHLDSAHHKVHNNHVVGIDGNGIVVDLRNRAYSHSACEGGYVEGGQFTNNTVHSCKGTGVIFLGDFVPRSNLGCSDPFASFEIDGLVIYGVRNGVKMTGVVGSVILNRWVVAAAEEVSVFIAGTAASTSRPKYSNGAIIAMVSHGALQWGSRTGVGIVTPRGHGMMIESTLLFDFVGMFSAALSPCLDDCVAGNRGFVTRFKNMKVESVTNLVRWNSENEAIYLDDDGTLTGTPGARAWAVPSSEILPPECVLSAKMAGGFVQGAECPGTVILFRAIWRRAVPDVISWIVSDSGLSWGLPLDEHELSTTDGSYARSVTLHAGGLFEFHSFYENDKPFSQLELHIHDSEGGGAAHILIPFKKRPYNVSINDNTDVKKAPLSATDSGETFWVRSSGVADGVGNVTFVAGGMSDVSAFMYKRSSCPSSGCVVKPPSSHAAVMGPLPIMYWCSPYSWPNWILPGEADIVNIPASTRMVVDCANAFAKQVSVHGVLEFFDAPSNLLKPDIGLAAHVVDIQPGGLLIAGSEARPFLSTGIITLLGSESRSHYLTGSGETVPSSSMRIYGELSFVGRPISTQRATLVNRARPGDVTIEVAGDCTEWIPGDTILLAPSGFLVNETEIRIIDRVDHNAGGGTTNVSFHLPLAHEHSIVTSGGLTQYPEVALMSRSLRISGSSSHGASIVVKKLDEYEAGKLTLKGAEIRQFGQPTSEDRLASGVILERLFSEGANTRIQDCVFLNGSESAIFLRESYGVKVERNVIYGTVGSGLVVHSGTSSLIVDNLIGGQHMRRRDDTTTASFEVAGAGLAAFTGNVAFGSEKNGYRLTGESCGIGPSNWGTNTAHSSVVGVRIDGNSTSDTFCTRVHRFNVFSAREVGVLAHVVGSIEIDSIHAAVSCGSVGVTANVVGHDSSLHMYGQVSTTISNSHVSYLDSLSCEESSMLTEGRSIGILIGAFSSKKSATLDGITIRDPPAFLGRTIIKNTILSSFQMGASAISTNARSPYNYHPVILETTQSLGSDSGSLIHMPVHSPGLLCGAMGCDGLRHAIVSDLDGSFFNCGTPPCTAVPVSRSFGVPNALRKYSKQDLANGFSEQNCTTLTEWNARLCSGTNVQPILFEDVDVKRGSPAVPPSLLSFSNSTDILFGMRGAGGLAEGIKVATVPSIGQVHYAMRSVSTHLRIYNQGIPASSQTLAIHLPNQRRAHVFVEGSNSLVALAPTNEASLAPSTSPGLGFLSVRFDAAHVPSKSQTHGTWFVSAADRILHVVSWADSSPISIVFSPSMIVEVGVCVPSVMHFVEAGFLRDFSETMNIDERHITVVNVREVVRVSSSTLEYGSLRTMAAPTVVYLAVAMEVAPRFNETISARLPPQQDFAGPRPPAGHDPFDMGIRLSNRTAPASWEQDLVKKYNEDVEAVKRLDDIGLALVSRVQTRNASGDVTLGGFPIDPRFPIVVQPAIMPPRLASLGYTGASGEVLYSRSPALDSGSNLDIRIPQSLQIRETSALAAGSPSKFKIELQDADGEPVAFSGIGDPPTANVTITRLNSVGAVSSSLSVAKIEHMTVLSAITIVKEVSLNSGSTEIDVTIDEPGEYQVDVTTSTGFSTTYSVVVESGGTIADRSQGDSESVDTTIILLVLAMVILVCTCSVPLIFLFCCLSILCLTALVPGFSQTSGCVIVVSLCARILAVCGFCTPGCCSVFISALHNTLKPVYSDERVIIDADEDSHSDAKSDESRLDDDDQEISEVKSFLSTSSPPANRSPFSHLRSIFRTPSPISFRRLKRKRPNTMKETQRRTQMYMAAESNAESEEVTKLTNIEQGRYWNTPFVASVIAEVEEDNEGTPPLVATMTPLVSDIPRLDSPRVGNLPPPVTVYGRRRRIVTEPRKKSRRTGSMDSMSSIGSASPKRNGATMIPNSPASLEPNVDPNDDRETLMEADSSSPVVVPLVNRLKNVSGWINVLDSTEFRKEAFSDVDDKPHDSILKEASAKNRQPGRVFKGSDYVQKVLNRVHQSSRLKVHPLQGAERELSQKNTTSLVSAPPPTTGVRAPRAGRRATNHLPLESSIRRPRPRISMATAARMVLAAQPGRRRAPITPMESEPAQRLRNRVRVVSNHLSSMPPWFNDEQMK